MCILAEMWLKIKIFLNFNNPAIQELRENVGG